MGRVWLQAATLAHTECALSLVNRGADLEKNEHLYLWLRPTRYALRYQGKGGVYRNAWSPHVWIAPTFPAHSPCMPTMLLHVPPPSPFPAPAPPDPDPFFLVSIFIVLIVFNVFSLCCFTFFFNFLGPRRIRDPHLRLRNDF